MSDTVAFSYDLDEVVSGYSQSRGVHPGLVSNLVCEGEIGRASRVLEVGCGVGNYGIELEPLTGCAYWGIDASGPMLAVAKRRLDKSRLVLGRGERLSFTRDAFDLVFSVDVVHHLADLSAYLHEAHRLLRAGGRICTATDSGWTIRHREPLATYFPETVEVDLGRYPPIGELRRAMQRVGFTDVRENMVTLRYGIRDTRPYRDRAFSCLHLIPPEAYERGMARLERDAKAANVQGTSRYVMVWGTKRAMNAQPASAD